jgi:hypothetical protein
VKVLLQLGAQGAALAAACQAVEALGADRPRPAADWVPCQAPCWDSERAVPVLVACRLTPGRTDPAGPPSRSGTVDSSGLPEEAHPEGAPPEGDLLVSSPAEQT